jgi:hypothetical protein
VEPHNQRPRADTNLLSSMESAGELGDSKVSSTELDSHANMMPVVGRNVAVISESGKTFDVCPFLSRL